MDGYAKFFVRIEPYAVEYYDKEHNLLNQKNWEEDENPWFTVKDVMLPSDYAEEHLGTPEDDDQMEDSLDEDMVRLERRVRVRLHKPLLEDS